jgi:hypothetical protein
MFQFFKFYLSALPSLPPASLSEHNLSGFLLVLLTATPLQSIITPQVKINCLHFLIRKLRFREHRRLVQIDAIGLNYL